MKKIILILTFCCVFIILKAQEESPTLKGKTQLNIGLGIFGWGGANIYPLHAGVDFFIINHLSLGIDMNWRYINYTSHAHQLFSAQAVIDYHLNEVMQLPNAWDVYAGIKAGPGYMTDPDNWNALYDDGIKFVFDGRFGGRYYFNEKLAVNAEIGLMTISESKTSGIAFTAGITSKL
ncbi:MAG: hypothetical protein V2I62_10850 [Bacteroidales bacterium]|jgi:hypothetical protein|nr:hypothetical protein [Bacteroidales bacterium]